MGEGRGSTTDEQDLPGRVRRRGVLRWDAEVRSRRDTSLGTSEAPRNSAVGIESDFLKTHTLRQGSRVLLPVKRTTQIRLWTPIGPHGTLPSPVKGQVSFYVSLESRSLTRQRRRCVTHGFRERGGLPCPMAVPRHLYSEIRHGGSSPVMDGTTEGPRRRPEPTQKGRKSYWYTHPPTRSTA